MQIEGGCHCGQIRYRAEVDPKMVAICHCSDCQALSGSAFRTIVPAPSAGFELLAGEPRRYVKTAASGNRRVQAFCPECGTPIYSCAEQDPPMYNIRVGTAMQRALLAPQRQIWCQSRLAWVGDLGIANQSERQ